MQRNRLDRDLSQLRCTWNDRTTDLHRIYERKFLPDFGRNNRQHGRWDGNSRNRNRTDDDQQRSGKQHAHIQSEGEWNFAYLHADSGFQRDDSDQRKED
jgi:hypothetical protein